MTISIQLTVVFHPPFTGNVVVGASTKLKLSILRTPSHPSPGRGRSHTKQTN